MKTALVLEGGAMRGMFTAGVLDILLANNIQVDGIVSVSAGALFGVNYPSKQAGRVLRYNLKLLGNKHYMGLYSLLTTGNIVNKDFAFYQVPYSIDPFDQQTFAQSGTDFYVTVTNIETGQAEYIKIHDVFQQMEAFRATSAMPLVSKIVELNGKKYLDGGISDSIPLQYCQSLGYEKIIVVLTRPLDYRKTPINPFLFKLFYKNYPHLIAAMANRHQVYNQTVENIIQLQRQNKIFVIRPSKTLPIKRIETDRSKIQAMYNLGTQDAQQHLAALENYLTD